MPYTPTVQDRTGEFLMRGITGAADSLAQGIQTYRKNKEEHGGLVSLVENKVKTSPGLAEKYGDKLAKAPAMSLSQLKALNSSLDLEMQNQRFEQDRKFKEEDLNLRKAYKDLQEQQLARANQRDAAGQRFIERLASLATAGGAPSMDFANTLAGEPMPARELGFADIVQAAGQSGLAMEPAALAPLIRAEQMGQRQDRGLSALQFQEDPVTGARMAVFGNSVLPTGINPAKQSAQAVDITDAEGNVIGRGLPGRNGFQLIKQPATEVDIKTKVTVLKDLIEREPRSEIRKRLQAELDALMKGGAKPTAADAVISTFETELNDLLNRRR